MSNPNMSPFKKFAVIGAGSWGTAIASHVAKLHKSVTLYSRSNETIAEINNAQTNAKYFGDIKLPGNIIASNNMEEVSRAEVIFIVVPSNGFNEILEQLKTYNIDKNTIFIIATKGISTNPVELFSERFARSFDNAFAFFLGPNLAKEIAAGKFASATIASNDLVLANKLAQVLSNEDFEITTTTDLITIQIAAIIKNIVAIKSGILEATNAGQNAKAWLITKGLQEISQISIAMGGRLETILEPAVIGDLILTSYSMESRNTRFGYELHKNNYSNEFINAYPFLVEGLEAAKLIKPLLSKYNINFDYLPIISSVIELANNTISTKH